MKPEDLTPDPKNANRGTKRGLEMLEKSFDEFGALRAAWADSDGIIRAGNKSYAEAKERGLKIRTVETTGDEFVVVVRNDISGQRAEKAGHVDNRVGQVDFDPDPEVLVTLMEEGIKFDDYYFNDELEKLLNQAVPEEGKAPKPPKETAVETPTDSNVKLVQLYYSPEGRDRFLAALNACVAKFNTDNPSDTVLLALEACAK